MSISDLFNRTTVCDPDNSAQQFGHAGGTVEPSCDDWDNGFSTGCGGGGTVSLIGKINYLFNKITGIAEDHETRITANAAGISSVSSQVLAYSQISAPSNLTVMTNHEVITAGTVTLPDLASVADSDYLIVRNYSGGTVNIVDSLSAPVSALYANNQFVTLSKESGAWVIYDSQVAATTIVAISSGLSLVAGADVNYYGATGYSVLRDDAGIWDAVNDRAVIPFDALLHVKSSVSCTDTVPTGQYLLVGGAARTHTGFESTLHTRRHAGFPFDVFNVAGGATVEARVVNNGTVNASFFGTTSPTLGGLLGSFLEINIIKWL